VRRWAVAALILSLAGSSASATPDFSGHWRVDHASLPPNREVKSWLLDAAGWAVGGVTSGVRLPADGQFHANTDEYCDEMAVTVTSPRSVRQQCRVRGTLAYDMEFTLSPDLKSLRRMARMTTSPDGSVSYSETRWRRRSKLPASAHPISGRWQTVADIIAPSAADDWRITMSDEHFSLRQGDGGGYDAIINGPPVAVAGDSSGAQSRIIRVSRRVIEEAVLEKDGRIAARMRMTLSPNGQSIAVANRRESGRYRFAFRLPRIG
jgi:hypothetical protein